VQLRKLVQMHPEGDNVKVTFYRTGKKQSASAKLVKKKWDDVSMNGNSSFGFGNAFGPGSSFGSNFQSGAQNFALELRELADTDRLKQQMDELEKSLQGLGYDKQKMKLEIERTMEQTRRAIEDAMRNVPEARASAGGRGGSGGTGSSSSRERTRTLGSLNRELAALAGSGVDIGKDSTIIIKNNGKSARTIVKTDETGSYVVVANPDKHLTIHDIHGKILFDGPIESSADQEKVPKELWDKVKPMLSQDGKGWKLELDGEAAPAAPPAPPAVPAAPAPAAEK
jgi:hypothetical protein